MSSALLTFYLTAAGVAFAVYLQKMNSGTITESMLYFSLWFYAQLFLNVVGWPRLNQHGTLATNWPIVPTPDDG
jgi:hypothetical protein